MNQRTVVITGASDGIGASAARTLKAKGNQVVIVGRSPDKTAAIGAELQAPFYIADFADLNEVRNLAKHLDSDFPRIHVLANNAGGIMSNRSITKDGFEKTFQVNHLAPFLLTSLLMDKLVASSAKVLQTSSIAAQRFGNLDLNDLNHERDYSPNKAYGDAKLANILFTSELQRRFGNAGIAAAAFHPGIVATNFASDSTSNFRFIYRTVFAKLFLISAEKGSKGLVWLAEGTPNETWQPGYYYEKNEIATFANPQIYDDSLARQFWDRSAEMLGVVSS